ncbi:hypothetical protein CALCODRAFT_491487 [Calocera cornea HHB12733]|uniref:Uncharacterized protein n=1 Tax=Calocera cornea HHB12733 TaxID=1353952 RepID=A0A165J4H7_9BASI|nr:hypothetical protein CALCODRAFT_491487 [Calocera cornea HHB12733]
MIAFPVLGALLSRIGVAFGAFAMVLASHDVVPELSHFTIQRYHCASGLFTLIYIRQPLYDRRHTSLDVQRAVLSRIPLALDLHDAYGPLCLLVIVRPLALSQLNLPELCPTLRTLALLHPLRVEPSELEALAAEHEEWCEVRRIVRRVWEASRPGRTLPRTHACRTYRTRRSVRFPVSQRARALSAFQLESGAVRDNHTEDNTHVHGDEIGVDLAAAPTFYLEVIVKWPFCF